MSYIEDTLMKNEKILYQAKPHWIIFAWPVVWCVIAILLFIFGPNILYADLRVIANLPLYALVALIAVALAIITAVITFITYQSSEYGITNKRVLMKVGFIRRLTLEIYLQKIESVKIYQGVLGRILGYGSVIISGVGGSKDPFTNIPNPLEFRRKIQEEVEITSAEKEHNFEKHSKV
jgi:uncharacterized membrane protein YdbT with pleckstrin-like domain